MAVLTPTGSALDRASPGFDALLGAIQNTSERIVRNREFAKQVQAQKNFAQFQADLEFESRRRQLTELTSLELERQQSLTDIQVDAQQTILRTQADLDVETTRRKTPLMIERAVSEQEALLPGQIEATTRLNEAQQPFTIADQQREHGFRMQQIAAQVSGRSSGTNPNYELQNALFQRFPALYSRDSRARQGNVHVEEGIATFNDGGQLIPMNLTQFTEIYNPVQNELEQTINYYQNLLNNENLLEDDLGSSLGKKSIEDRINQLRSAQNDILSFVETEDGERWVVPNTALASNLLNEFRNNQSLARVSDSQLDALDVLRQSFSNVRNLSIGTSSDPREEPESFGSIYSKLVANENNLSEESRQHLSSLKALRATWEMWTDRPRHVVDQLYINWDFNPLLTPSETNPPLITETELQQKLTTRSSLRGDDVNTQNTIEFLEGSIINQRGSFGM